MKIELELTDRQVQKIRALNQLLGSPAELFETLPALVEQVVDDAIVTNVLGRRTPPQPLPPAYAAAPPPPQYAPQAEDISGISAGLGDVDESDLEELGSSDPMAFVPKSGTGGKRSHAVSETEAEHDTPPEEGGGFRAAPGKSNPARRPEEEMADILGIQPPKLDPLLDPRDERRGRRPLPKKAKVNAFGVDEPERTQF